MRTVLASFMFILGSVSVAFAQESETETPVIVLGIRSVEGDDSAAQTVSRTLRALAANRAGWVESDRDVTLAQMMLAHGCYDVVDRTCASQIGASFQPDHRGILVFGQMRRQGAGLDQVRIELVLFDIALDRATHRAAFDERLSELIVGGRLDDRAQAWLERLMSSGTEFEDTGQPYFDSVETPPMPLNPHEGLELAGWSLVGFAVASAVAAIASGSLLLGLNGDARYNAYREDWEVGSVGNVCDAAAGDPSPEGRHALGVCGDASIHEVLVPLFWTVAALSGAAGILLAWHPWTASAESPTVSLAPAVGPTFAGLDLSGTF